MSMFARLFGVASEDLRAIVAEALASQREVIVRLETRNEALIAEVAALKAGGGEVEALRSALLLRDADLAELRAALDSLAVGNQTLKFSSSVGSTEPIPARRPAFANSSYAAGHQRQRPREVKS